MQIDLWWQALAELGIDWQTALHRPHRLDSPLPWDHIAIRQGRGYLATQQDRAAAHLATLACAGEGGDA